MPTMQFPWMGVVAAHERTRQLLEWAITKKFFELPPPDSYSVVTECIIVHWCLEGSQWDARIRPNGELLVTAYDMRFCDSSGYVYDGSEYVLECRLTDLVGWLHRFGGNDMALKIKRAQVKSRPLKVGIMAPSGAGKTFTSLLFAKAIEEVTGLERTPERNFTLVLDSENESSSLYADQFGDWSYDVGEADKTWEGYESALREAIKQGYKVLIVDSATHLWLALKDSVSDVAKNNRDVAGNKMAAWGLQKSRARQFLEFLTRLPIHVVVTFRADTVMEEQEYVVNGRTKTKRVAVGVKPEYDGDPSYEFDLFASMTRDHTMSFLKARRASEQLDSKEFEKPGYELIAMLLEGFQAGSVETTATKLTGRIEAASDEKELLEVVLPQLTTAKTDPTVSPAELSRLREAYAVKRAELQKKAKAQKAEPFSALAEDEVNTRGGE